MTEAASPGRPAATADTGQQDALQAFVEWLVANGVRGIGGEDGNVAIYQEADGMRGIVCLRVGPGMHAAATLNSALAPCLEHQRCAEFTKAG